MPSFKLSIVAVATALFSAVSADYYIDPDSVSLTTRKSWCTNEISTCPLICEQVAPYTTTVNTCDAETLTYGCVCGDGLQPNISEYSLTLPYFVCQEWGNQCVTQCGLNNPDCSSACREDHPCGAQNPTRVNVTSSAASDGASATGSASASADQVYSGFGDATTTAADATKTKTSGTKTTGTAGSATTTEDSLTAAAATTSSTSASTGAALPSVDASRAFSLMATMAGLVAGFAILL